MRKLILSLLSFLVCNMLHAQCITNSIIINTGYNPITNSAITGGAVGATPVADPHWVLTAESPAVAPAIAATPVAGLIAVTPGSAADVVAPSSTWAVNPAANPGGWISCLNSFYYYDPGTGVPLNMTLGRKFRTCTEDDITISVYIANDNYISATNVDGTIPLTFSQPAGTSPSYYSTFTFFTQTVHLLPGVHTINFVVNNYNVSTFDGNPTGLDVYGTVSSATGLNSIVSENVASCATYVCGANCNTVSLPDTLKLCEHTSDTLRGSIVGTDSVLSITWSPVAGLSSSTVIKPQVTVGTVSGYYYVNVRSLTPYNTVYNGDFSLGNTGFSSTYTYVTGPSSLVPEATYAVTTNPTLVHPGAVSFGDHTTGTGNMMAVNGSSTPTSVWCQTIPVSPNTDYYFSAWAANWSTASSGVNAPILQFKINGLLIGTPYTLTTGAGVWANFSTIWNSGTATSANICVYDACTALSGNDFSLDDISFKKICTAIDSEYVAVKLIDTTKTHHDTLVCSPITAVTLTAPSGYNPYTWSTGATTSSITVSAFGNYWVYAGGSCSLLIDTFKVIAAPVDTSYHSYDSVHCASAGAMLLTATAGSTYLWSTGATTASITTLTPGTYWVYVASPCIMVIDTFHVSFDPSPVVNIGNDTAFCDGNSLVLTSIQPVGNTYLWNTGATGNTITVSTSGNYWLQVDNGCKATDTIHIAIDPLPVVNLGPDTNSCVGVPVVLQSVISYPATYTYLWNTLATTSSIAASASGTYWLRVFSNAGCSSIDTINVQILYDTVTLLTGDTSLCKGMPLTVYTWSDPHNTFDWVPTTGIANPNVPGPLIMTDTSAMYYMIAHYPGCPDIRDSFFFDVQPNPHVYIGGNRPVCQFDTLHIHASVAESWYTHYSYSWTPTANLDHPTYQDVIFTAGNPGKIYVTVTTPRGCSGIDSAYITVYPGNFAHVDSIYDICPHDSVHLVPGGGVAYNWSPSMYLDDANGLAPWSRPITSLTYTMVATSDHGCKDTLDVRITVHPQAMIYLPDSVTIFPGESYHISPQTNCTSFSWTPAAGLNDPYVSDPVATPLLDTRYIVTGITQYGCVTTDSISIYAKTDAVLALPNAFTPGTGGNNKFMIAKRGLVQLKHFRIYNRWGNLVFETTNIDAGWDGTYNGTPQPLGVYVYDIEAVTDSGTVFQKHGNVTLLR